MPRHALVVRDRLHVQQQPLLGSVFVHIDPPRPRSVSRPDRVIGGYAVGAAKRLHRHHVQLVLRKSPENFRQLLVHLVAILGVQIEQLLPRFRVQRRVLPNMCVERFQILEALSLGELEHVAFDLRHASQAQHVNLLRRELAGGLVFHRDLVTDFAVGQRPHARLEPPVGCVLLANKLGELCISGSNFALDRTLNALAQPRPLRFRNRVRELPQRVRERTLVQGTIRDSLRLPGYFFQQIFRRHQVVAQPLPHVAGRLIQHSRNLLQARAIVLVVLNIAKRRVERQGCVPQVDTSELRRGHFPVFELREFQSLRSAGEPSTHG